MKYTHIFFDADETLFSFNAKLGLQTLFAHHGIEFTDEDYQNYQAINAPLWIKYQHGEIDARTLQVTRFKTWSKRLNIPAEQLNDGFLAAMAEICEPLPGARDLLARLKPKATLGIITNGFAALQQRRLAHTGLAGCFKTIVISELVGHAKPDPRIFAKAFNDVGNPEKEKVLMVGDTATSDILGANQFGIDSCWLQHPGSECPQHINPTYTVKNLAELDYLLLGELN
ncbi:5'-nucleotidase YjjG [Pseudoalteromonas luteoviolacea B = ATCC 29581]|nr:5'-nucleotidase YjjG [Pseudoalteromonas luteoviolacea B = ATCC 29581]